MLDKENLKFKSPELLKNVKLTKKLKTNNFLLFYLEGNLKNMTAHEKVRIYFGMSFIVHHELHGRHNSY